MPERDKAFPLRFIQFKMEPISIEKIAFMQQ